MQVPWILLPFLLTTFATHNACLQRQLVDRQAQGLASYLFTDTGEFEENPARLDVGDPPFRRTLTGTHAGFGRLLGQGTVRVDVDPDLTATLDVAGHRNTGRFDLTVGDVCRAQSLDTPLAERDLGAARSSAGTTRVVLLTVLDSTWDKHLSLSSFYCSRCSLNCRCLCSRSCVGGRTVVATTAVTAVSATRAARTIAGTAAAGRSSSCLLSQFLGGDVTLVDPDLHADAAEGGLGLVEAVVDVRAEGVQGHTAFAVELRAGHFCATQSTRASDTDALGTSALCRLHCLLHRTAECHAGSQLLCNALGHKLGFHLGVLDLEDVQLDLLAGELFELAADAVCLGAAAADNDARTCRVDIHADTVAGALDFDLGDAGPLHARGHELADTDVFANEVLVPLTGLGAVSEPVRYVIGGDAESEPVRV